MESTLEDLKNRRSIRKFSDKEVSDEDIAKILEAGTYAPTGMGAQSPKIVLIKDQDTIKKISKWNASFFPEEAKANFPEDFDPFYGAMILAIVLADSNIPTHVEDGSLVMGNMLNAAYPLGVGACWIHRAREEFDSLQGKELLKVWNIPESYVGVGHCIIGYPADDVEIKDVPRKDDYIVYADL